MKDHKILGVILAGGKSSRFGSNKSLSNLKNFKLIEHVIQKLNKKFTMFINVSAIMIKRFVKKLMQFIFNKILSCS